MNILNFNYKDIKKYAVAFLNSATIPHGKPGEYVYIVISKEDFVNIVDYLRKRNDIAKVSYIGYENTLEYINELTGLRLNINRITTYDLKKFDYALVLRLNYRVYNPKKKKYIKPSPEDWEYGIFKLIKAYY